MIKNSLYSLKPLIIVTLSCKLLTTFKTKTGEETLLVLKNKGRNGELTIYTTNPQELSYSNMQGEEAEAHKLNISVLNSAPIPSFTELTRASPSKGKTSKRINIDSDIDDKHCRICKIKLESAVNVSSNSPWLGCAGKWWKRMQLLGALSVQRFWGCF